MHSLLDEPSIYQPSPKRSLEYDIDKSVVTLKSVNESKIKKQRTQRQWKCGEESLQYTCHMKNKLSPQDWLEAKKDTIWHREEWKQNHIVVKHVYFPQFACDDEKIMLWSSSMSRPWVLRSQTMESNVQPRDARNVYPHIARVQIVWC